MTGKSPGFWFFTGDWMKDTELRFCSIFARGLLVDLLCIMFEAKDCGYLSKPDGAPRSDREIVDAISGGTVEDKLSALSELEASGVLSRDSRNVLYSRRLSRLKDVSEARRKAGSKGGSKRKAKLKQNSSKQEANPQANEKQNRGVTVSDSASVSDSVTDTDTGKDGASALVGLKQPTISVDDFFARWNAFAERKGLSKVLVLNDDRKAKIRTRLKGGKWWNRFLAACEKLPLPGDGWQPDLDWIVENESNVERIIEGKYDWRATVGKIDPDPRGTQSLLEKRKADRAANQQT